MYVTADNFLSDEYKTVAENVVTIVIISFGISNMSQVYCFLTTFVFDDSLQYSQSQMHFVMTTVMTAGKGVIPKTLLI